MTVQGPALRPYLPADAPRLAAIFREAVEELTIDEYDEAQRAAWASAADDVAAFGARLGSMLTLVAAEDGKAMAFASLEDNEMIAMLYVHPDAAGRGFAPSPQTVSARNVMAAASAPAAASGSHAASHGWTKPSSPMVSEMPSTMK